MTKNGQVVGAAYVTQGQKPFTYNDITKYFKYGDKYKQHVKLQYQNEEEYQKDMLRMYTIKVNAFEVAQKRICEEHPEMNDIQSFLQQEVEENGFHEKSELREKINEYMSEYIAQNFGDEIQKKYEQFYWTTASDIDKETEKSCNLKAKGVSEYETFLQSQAQSQDYEKILKHQALKIYEEPSFDESIYYSANTSNSVELDTYITSPEIRSAGTARIMVFEGIKKHIERHFQNTEDKEIFLCSTLHRENLPSKYVSEFFGLTDSIYINRRQGRDREVHICRIPREQAMEYLTAMSEKLAVLYGYNPEQKNISSKVRLRVLKEQLEYEKKEYDRLQKARTIDKKFSGPNIKVMEGKLPKIKGLEKQIREIEESNKGEQ